MLTAIQCLQAVSMGRQIPMHMASTEVEQAILDKVNHGWLGINTTDLYISMHEKRNLEELGFIVNEKDPGIYWLYTDQYPKEHKSII